MYLGCLLTQNNINSILYYSHSDLQMENLIDETSCYYVGSRGLLKCCDCKSATPWSSVREVINQDFGGLKNGDSIYICSSALSHFVSNILDKILVRFVLVTGDSDAFVPTTALSDAEFHKLIRSDKLIAWFSQNLVGSPIEYPKLHYLPIGLDYHTMSERELFWGPVSSPKTQEVVLNAVINHAQPFHMRIPTAYTTFHFALHRGGRQEAYEQIPQDLVYYEPERTSRLVSWKRQIEYAFVVSPPGEGIDCHRTWEALCLGCIPILLSTPLDPLYDGLPVLIVKSWKDVTRELLEKTIVEYRDKPFLMEKLSLQYWVDKIRSASASGR